MTAGDPGQDGGGRGHRVPRPGRGTAIVAAALLLIAVAALVRVQTAPEPAPAPRSDASTTPSPSSSPSPPVVAGPRPPAVAPALMRGSRDAPVTMVVFGDYRCPYCAAFARDQQPELVREYVETGRLRLAWRDYPYRGEVSEQAAVAARAAARQDAFWEYGDALYADPDAWTSGTGEEFTRIAADLGLDTDRFREDVDDPELRSAVEDDMDFALGLGVPGTPAFLINGEAFFGAQPIEEFEERIEAAETG
ncbi:protein-disulfide isomerase [Spinactinospora alkalitolerans]|uniref:Protein-disulfide isomerase n=1 Tax=Spinactinospora alkalitolerans TaxID=687207 RepID=A0A852TY18_9ACTN|nr:thioredoxin domain-containing protein [Spinactinospora alkalitolerans]NYE47862.1 protein-disulfide isomerase [Spinactinospora alkalitolerans]